MTKRELIRAEINLKSRWSQAIYQQQLAKEKPERKEITEEAANVALGYMYAIADILQVTKGVSNADSIVRAWADEVEEKEGSSPGMRKPKLVMELGYDSTGKTFWTISSPKGGELSLNEIANTFVNMNGGGIYAVILNCNGGEQFDKISRVDVYDIFDLIDQVIRMV